MNEPKSRESDAAPDVRIAQIRARAEACELVYLSPLAEQVVKEDLPWLLDRLAALTERVAWFEKSGGVTAHTRVFEEMHRAEQAEAALKALRRERDEGWEAATAAADDVKDYVVQVTRAEQAAAERDEAREKLALFRHQLSVQEARTGEWHRACEEAETALTALRAALLEARRHLEVIWHAHCLYPDMKLPPSQGDRVLKLHQQLAGGVLDPDGPRPHK